MYLIGWLRGFIADYGVPLMVLVWTALSYGVPGKIPSGVPRRLYGPLVWDSVSTYHWTVIKVIIFFTVVIMVLIDDCEWRFWL